MGSSKINLAIRFFLEIAALVSVGIWGWAMGDSPVNYAGPEGTLIHEPGTRWLQPVLGIGIPLLLAVIWGVFAVPDDPSRSGKAPIPVPGFLRLIIELAIFGFAVGVLYILGYNTHAIMFGILVVVHYAISYDRIAWLFRH